MSKVIGWTDPYQSTYKKKDFGEDQRQALIGLIRKRKYYFTYTDHEFLPYCTPLYKGNYYCTLTKHEFDSVFAEAYNKESPGEHLVPLDVLSKKAEDALME